MYNAFFFYMRNVIRKLHAGPGGAYITMQLSHDALRHRDNLKLI